MFNREPTKRQQTREDTEKLQKELYQKAVKTNQNMDKQPHPDFDEIPNEEYEDEDYEEELDQVDKVENKKNRKTQRVTKKPFFKSGFFGMKIGKKHAVESLISPVLFLERDSMKTEVIEDVEPGIFPIRDKGKGIICSPLKLRKMEYNGEYIDYWYANENQAVAGFPDPIMDAEIVYQTTKKTVLNYEEFDKDASNFKIEQLKMIAMIAGAGILIVWLIWSGTLQQVLAKFGFIDLAKNTAGALGNTTNAITGGGTDTTTPAKQTSQIVTETAPLLFAIGRKKIQSFFSLHK